MPSFTLKNNFEIFGPNLPKKDNSGEKWKKRTLPLKSAYSNLLRCLISAQSDNFEFLDQISALMVFPVDKRKSKHQN